MPDRPDEPLPVLVHGTVRGRTIDGEGLFRATADGVEVRMAGGSLVASCASLDGIEAQGSEVVLVLANGDTLRLEGSGRVVAAARELVQRSCAIPELTRALRALGARNVLGPDQEQLFGPLLAARKRAERATELRTRVAAFDAAALRDAWERALHDSATRRFPHDAPDRRALAAELADVARPYLATLERVEHAASALRAAPEASRLRLWREWTAVIAELFASADRLWLAWAPILAAEPGRRVSWWRRLLRPRRRRELW
jgi:hypothetical protein